jgi:hypothetical protein
LPPGPSGDPAIIRRRSLGVVLLRLALTLLALALGGAVGCGGPDDAPGASLTFGPSTVNDYTVALLVTPYPPEPRSRSEFLITVTDKAGDPVSGAQVQLDMTMPAMPMPPNRPEAVEKAPGQYATPVTFTMAGEWQALITVKTPQGEDISVSFDMETQ